MNCLFLCLSAAEDDWRWQKKIFKVYFVQFLTSFAYCYLDHNKYLRLFRKEKLSLTLLYDSLCKIPCVTCLTDKYNNDEQLDNFRYATLTQPISQQQ